MLLFKGVVWVGARFNWLTSSLDGLNLLQKYINAARGERGYYKMQYAGINKRTWSLVHIMSWNMNTIEKPRSSNLFWFPLGFIPFLCSIDK